MKVALDIGPIKGGHSVRGIGSYTLNLMRQFKKKKWEVDFDFFENKIPSDANLIHYPYFDLFFHTLPIRKEVPRIVTIHDVIPLVFPNYFPSGIRGNINYFFQKKALNNVDAVICDSETSKGDIISKLSIPKSKVNVVYLAPGEAFKKVGGTERVNKISAKYNLPREFILYVGDVNWNKNVENLIEAVKISKVNLVMVGKALQDDSLIQTREINNLIRKLDIEEKILKLGFISEEELVAIYNLASLTVLPSFYEGFGLPVLESMACGTPVVCSGVASLSEIIDDSAIICEPSDPDDIADKIKKVLNFTTKERNTFSEKSQKHALSFSWEKVAKNTISVYKKVLEK